MHAKTIGRLSGVFVLAAAFIAVNSTAPLAVTSAEATEITHPFNASADRSHEAAQSHLDKLFDFALSPAAARAIPRVKIDIHGKTIWVEPVARADAKFVGVLPDDDGSDPSRLIEFERADVRDWTFIGHDRKMYGSFQTRARLAHLSPQNAVPILAVLAPSTTPPNW